ncbi:MAG: hypothetical protein WBN08_11610 [Thiogranum sp.]
MFAYLSERNIINMLYAAFGALLAISAILVVALKRLDIGLISLLPNIISATMALGLCGLLVGDHHQHCAADGSPAAAGDIAGGGQKLIEKKEAVPL